MTQIKQHWLHWFERRWIIDMIVYDHMTASAIAQKIGCTRQTVLRVVKKEMGTTYLQLRIHSLRKVVDKLPRSC